MKIKDKEFRCPTCDTPYIKNIPGICRYCKEDLTLIKESGEKQRKEKLLIDIKCSKCQSDDIELRFEINLHTGYITCNTCKNVDTRELINSKLGDLTKCDLCGNTTTEIELINGYLRPLWTHSKFNYIDNVILCEKCFKEQMKDLEQKDTKEGKKNPIIEYYFDGDSLKYWKKGNDGADFEEIEVNNDDGKQRYNKAIKKMKSKFSKRTKFIDIDE